MLQNEVFVLNDGGVPSWRIRWQGHMVKTTWVDKSSADAVMTLLIKGEGRVEEDGTISWKPLYAHRKALGDLVRKLETHLDEWDEHLTGCNECAKFELTAGHDRPCEVGSVCIRGILRLLS